MSTTVLPLSGGVDRLELLRGVLSLVGYWWSCVVGWEVRGSLRSCCRLDVAVVARDVVGELCVALMLQHLGRPGLVMGLAVRSRGRFANHC